ncbi:hypothetical protein AKO1_005361 [Acrasis kona]|uniref:Uncharacterized protein n=1 Tax=Acrasis kona TaxID=1008807 RepID=A0AAW2YM45_9EUKA
MKSTRRNTIVGSAGAIKDMETSRRIRPAKIRNFGEVPKNERLAQILAKSVKFKRDGQSKSLLWLLRLMSSIYKNKIDHDAQVSQSGVQRVDYIDPNVFDPLSSSPSSSSSVRMSLPEFLFEHLKQIYGAQKLVEEYAGSVIATIIKYRQVDRRVDIFGRFVNEDWDLPVLDLYLKTWIMVEDFKHGPEFCHQKPLDDMPKYARISKVRALYILKTLKRDLPTLIDQIVRLMEKRCEEVTEDEFKKAMIQAGYKYIPSQFNPMSLWGVDAVTARQVINKCDFLDIVCSVMSSTVSDEDERSIINEEVNKLEESDYISNLSNQKNMTGREPSPNPYGGWE